MSKEIFHALAKDIERLLMAGGAMVEDDSNLRARHNELKSLATKIPALAKVADQIGKTIDASNHQRSVELLNLAVLSAQLLGAQAQAAHCQGEITDLPTFPAIETPLAGDEIEPIYNEFIGRSKGDKEITAAIDNAKARDLRLLNCWLDHLGWARLDNLVNQLGDAVVAPLMEKLNINGDYADAHILQWLAKVRRLEIKDLLMQAIEQGSAKVAAAALTILAELDWLNTEALVQTLARSTKMPELRIAAVQLLKKSDSDEAIDALIAAIMQGKSYHDISATCKAMEAAPRNVIAKLFDQLIPEIDKQMNRKRGSPLYNDLYWLIEICAKRFEEARQDDRLLPFMLKVWSHHKDFSTRAAAGSIILRLNDRNGWQAVADGLYTFKFGPLSEGARRVAIAAIIKLRPDDAFIELSRYFDWQLIGNDTKQQIILASIIEVLAARLEANLDVDARWFDLCLEKLADKENWLPIYNDAAYPLCCLSWLLEKKLDGRAAPLLFDLLDFIFDQQKTFKSCLDTERLTPKFLGVLKSLDDINSAPRLRAWATRNNRLDDVKVKNVLEHLERTR